MAAVDVIIPPPEIKAIVDKTADFVAKHGPALEQKILGREAGVKKFEFLLTTSVYHAYYRAKVTECSGGASGILFPRKLTGWSTLCRSRCQGTKFAYRPMAVAFRRGAPTPRSCTTWPPMIA